MNTLTVNLQAWKCLILFIGLPFLLIGRNTSKSTLHSTNRLDCPTNNLVINSSEVNDVRISSWIATNQQVFTQAVKDLGGLWALDDITITHDYENTLPHPVCQASEGGLLVIFKATNQEEDAIRCGATLVILDDELVVPQVSDVVTFSSSYSLKASIDTWLITYPASLRNQLADEPSFESKEDLIITHDFDGVLPNWTCQDELNNELAVTFTIEDKCGNVATQVRRMVVEDYLPPQLSILSPIEVERRESYTPEYTGYAAVADECSAVEDIQLNFFDDLSKIDRDTIVRKWLATDVCGNTDSIVQIIKLVDRERFLDVACAPENTIINCRGKTANSTALAAWRQQIEEKLAVSCTQNDAAAISYRVSNVNLFGAEDCGHRSGGSILTYTISDDAGNFTLKKAKATILDNTPPMFGAPLRNGGNTCDARSFIDIGLLRNNFINTAFPYALGNILNERDCSEVQVASYRFYTGNPNKAFPKRKYEQFIFNFRDGCGNVLAQTPTYFAQDTLPPVVTCEPLDKVLTCVGDAANEQAAIEWNENNLQLLTECSKTECFGIKSITSDYNFIDLSGKCAENRSLTVTYKVTDAFDNTTTKLATFLISNSEELQVTCEPVSDTHACNGTQRNVQAAENWNALNMQFLRDCAASQCGAIKVSSDYNFANFRRACGLTGELVVNFLIEDGCSSITKTATFTIFDDRRPIPASGVYNLDVECRDDQDILLEASEWNQGVIARLQGSFDNCGTIQVRSDYNPQNILADCGLTGAATITFEVIDECGMIYTDDGTIRITDQTVPTVDCAVQDITVGCLSNSDRRKEIEVWNQRNIALLQSCSDDNCGNISISSDLAYNQISVGCGEETKTVVTYKVEDDCSNFAQVTATINVLKEDTYTPDCGQVVLKVIGSQLSILHLKAPNVTTKIYTEEWELVYECVGDCTQNITLPNLALGTLYRVQIQFFDVNWQPICETTQDITTDVDPCDLSICEGTVILKTQAEVDAFCGCEVIEGQLRIGSGSIFETCDINSLESLSVLKAVKESVSIVGTQLVNLRGLDNLTRVEEGFRMSFNALLKNLSGLDQLKYVGSSLTLFDHNKLENIDVLSNLNYVGGGIGITKNSLLKNLAGFTNLQVNTLTSISISENPSLITLDGLEGIESLTGTGFQGLTIENNENLQDVSALSSIRSIAGKFFLRSNPKLSCCSLTHLVDFDNDNGLVGGSFLILNNSEFCNDRREIVATCTAEPSISCEDLQILTNQDNQLIIKGLTAPNTITKIYDPNWQLISNCSGDCPETVTITDLNAGDIYHTDIQFYDESWDFICEDKQDVLIEGISEPCDTLVCQSDVILRTQAEVDAFCGCTLIEGDLKIGETGSEDLPDTDITNLNTLAKTKFIKGSLMVGRVLLEDLSGLENLESIGTSLTVIFNPNLKNYTGLNSLATINDDFVSIYNPRLENFTGLNSLKTITDYIYIEGNQMLSSLNGLNNLSTIGHLQLE
ncbi:MAG: hypothetical protein AAGJ18_10055, partial [Bacteroidota bacterium]